MLGWLYFVTVHELACGVLDTWLSLERHLCLLIQVLAPFIVTMSMGVHGCPSPHHFRCYLPIDRRGDLAEKAALVLLDSQVCFLATICLFACALLRGPRP